MLHVYHGRSRSSRSPRARRWLAGGLLWCLTVYGIAPIIINAQVSVNGNISPYKIEVDPFANFTSPDSNSLNGLRPGIAVDWQKDNLPNTDTPDASMLPIAIGIIRGTSGAGVTGAPNGQGHWYGARIVDGMGGFETDEFLSGGKVNDPTSWQIGPGTIGSSKYDATQAYLANNDSDIFFGMERAGNNGTTAFDFEFNQRAPAVPTSGNPYIPNRTEGDILISFEMQGSGGASGSVETFIFRFESGLFVLKCDSVNGGSCPADLFTSINAANTPSEAWGHVDSHRNWTTNPVEQRLFAEASVPLTVLPGATSCNGALYVQVRTRASSALGSDAKDTTPIFKYIFRGPSASGNLTPNCGLDIPYDGSLSRNSSGGTTNLTYQWTFQRNDGGTWTNVGTRSDISGVFTAPTAGTYRAILVITEGGSCTATTTTAEKSVQPPVGGSASLTPDCDDTFAYSASGTGGSGTYNFAWTIYKGDGSPGDPVAKTFSCGPAASCSGTLDIDDFNTGAKGEGKYYAKVVISDAGNSTCTFTASTNAIDVRYPLTASAVKQGASVPAGGDSADNGFTATLTGSTNALAGDTVATEWQYFSGGSWVASGDLDLTYTRSLADIFTLGTMDTASTSILTDSYMLKRGTLQVRLHAVRTLNGQTCTADSAPVLVKALKAVDP